MQWEHVQARQSSALPSAPYFASGAPHIPRQGRLLQMENHQNPRPTVFYVLHDDCLNLGSYAGCLLDHVMLQFHGRSEGLRTASYPKLCLSLSVHYTQWNGHLYMFPLSHQALSPLQTCAFRTCFPHL